MKQGVLVKGRVKLLMRPGMSCFRPRREGHIKRKSIRGCIVGQDIAVLSLSVVKKGEKDIPGIHYLIILDQYDIKINNFITQMK